MTTDGGQKYSPNSLILQNYSRKTIEAKIMKIVSDDSKLVFVINILTVVYCCLLFSYTNRLRTKEKKYNHTIFSMTLTLASLEKKYSL